MNTNAPSGPDQGDDLKSRKELIADIKRSAKDLRAQLKPELLSQMRQLIDRRPVQEASEEIKIDRARNVAFVHAFLDSPAGAKLKEKLSVDSGLNL